MLNTPDPALVELLEAGTSSGVVCVLTPDGEPFATRTWGVAVRSRDPLTVHVLLSAGDLAAVGRRVGDDGTFPIAITCTDVPSLRGVQIKGSATALVAATEADHARFEAYVDRFFDTIHHTDGYDPEALRRLAPVDLVASTIEVEELFDQTPGPQAGVAIVDGAAP